MQTTFGPLCALLSMTLAPACAFADVTLHPPEPSTCATCKPSRHNLPFHPPTRSVILSSYSGMDGRSHFHVVDIDRRQICAFEIAANHDSEVDFRARCRYRKLTPSQFHDIVAEANYVWNPPVPPMIEPPLFSTDRAFEILIFDHERSYSGFYESESMLIQNDPTKRIVTLKQGLVDAVEAAAR